MPLIWAAISAHGYGHAAQVVPVLNALGRLIPNLRVLLRTMVPPAFFNDRLTIPWERQAVQQDVGCIQQGPLTIDVDATWYAHDRFHHSWDERVHTEVRAMQAANPDLVVADTPYLAIAAAQQAGIRAIALSNFTWDLILSDYATPPSIDRQRILTSIRQAYAQANLALRITPAPAMPVFPRQTDIQPIAEPLPSARASLSTTLNLSSEERIVLIGFGGIPLNTLPVNALRSSPTHRFLFDGPTPTDSTQFISTHSLPFSFKTLLASVDAIMTKPGYGTLVEAVALQIPVVYVRRYNFADEPPLVEYLHRYGRGVELSRDDFEQGQWSTALQHVLTLPPGPLPTPPTGAAEAAAHLATFLSSPRS